MRIQRRAAVNVRRERVKAGFAVLVGAACLIGGLMLAKVVGCEPRAATAIAIGCGMVGMVIGGAG
jgi:hypothetical protein